MLDSLPGIQREPPHCGHFIAVLLPHFGNFSSDLNHAEACSTHRSQCGKESRVPRNEENWDVGTGREGQCRCRWFCLEWPLLQPARGSPSQPDPRTSRGISPQCPRLDVGRSIRNFHALINVPALLGSWLFTQFSVVVKLSSFILLT